jgi:hypothetical protein
MSRELLYGSYEGGSFILRNADRSIYLKIDANTVFSIGNSIGGYYAKRVRYADEQMIALIRISGKMKYLPISELKSAFKNERGYILKPGKGLWATSSGSAMKGLWHRNHGSDNPIIIALRMAELPSSLLKIVDKIDAVVYTGGNLCQHSTQAGNYKYDLKTDGEVSVMAFGPRVTKHVNKFHIGCQSSEDVCEVVGGTYYVQSIKTKAQNGGNYPNIRLVAITPDADKQAVAGVIRNIMG